MSGYVAAVRQAATVVDVPGAPLSLRLEHIEMDGGTIRLRWSFGDPQASPDDRASSARRIRGEQEESISSGDVAGLARSWWAAAQLAAAHRYQRLVDADWTPGEQPRRAGRTVDQAWEALLAYLRQEPGEVSAHDGAIRATRDSQEYVYRIDPAEWAVFVTGAATNSSSDPGIVPAACRLVDGLPAWAVDQLVETAGAFGPVIGLVDGQLVGL